MGQSVAMKRKTAAVASFRSSGSRGTPSTSVSRSGWVVGRVVAGVPAAGVPCAGGVLAGADRPTATTDAARTRYVAQAVLLIFSPRIPRTTDSRRLGRRAVTDRTSGH